MGKGKSAVIREKTFAEKMKSRKVQQLLVIVTFLFAPPAIAGRVYLSAIHENGAVQFL